MAESTLSLQLSDFATEVSDYLGYGRTLPNLTGWDTLNPYVPKTSTITISGVPITVGANDTQLGHVMACVHSGYRRFLNPKLVDEGPISHQWSFLSPERTLQVVANVSDYDLPDDFGGVDGEFNYQATDSTLLTVSRHGIGEVKRLNQQNQAVTGKPQIFATYPKQTDGASGQRFAIAFTPIPDATYTLTYRAKILPLALSATKPWPWGGEAHGETILEAMLAVAELKRQDEPGNHAADFKEQLTASIAADIRDNEAEFFGYNADRSDRRMGLAPWGAGVEGSWVTSPATYNGGVIS